MVGSGYVVVWYLTILFYILTFPCYERLTDDKVI